MAKEILYSLLLIRAIATTLPLTWPLTSQRKNRTECFKINIVCDQSGVASNIALLRYLPYSGDLNSMSANFVFNFRFSCVKSNEICSYFSTQKNNHAPRYCVMSPFLRNTKFECPFILLRLKSKNSICIKFVLSYPHKRTHIHKSIDHIDFC